MYLFTEYVFRESVDSAHNSQISRTFQEADCLLKLVKINKQVFTITLLSRNLNHTAQLSISARGGGGIIILSVRLGGGGDWKRPISFSTRPMTSVCDPYSEKALFEAAFLFNSKVVQMYFIHSSSRKLDVVPRMGILE